MHLIHIAMWIVDPFGVRHQHIIISKANTHEKKVECIRNMPNGMRRQSVVCCFQCVGGTNMCGCNRVKRQTGGENDFKWRFEGIGLCSVCMCV